LPRGRSAPRSGARGNPTSTNWYRSASFPDVLRARAADPARLIIGNRTAELFAEALSQAEDARDSQGIERSGDSGLPSHPGSWNSERNSSQPQSAVTFCAYRGLNSASDARKDGVGAAACRSAATPSFSSSLRAVWPLGIRLTARVCGRAGAGGQAGLQCSCASYPHLRTTAEDARDAAWREFRIDPSFKGWVPF